MSGNEYDDELRAENERLRAVVARVEGLAECLEQRKIRALVEASEYWEASERSRRTGRSVGLGIAERLLRDALTEPAQMPQDGSGPSTDTESAPAGRYEGAQGAGDGV